MWAPLILAAAAAAPALAQSTCNITNPCPKSAPCCSPYGFCGKASSSYCLGGCEPYHSFQLTSCKPEPVCQHLSTDFNDLSRVLMNGTKYDGNATAYDWVVDKGSIEPAPGGDGGTLISSTRYVHYGLIDFTFEASKWGGVVSAAITMSDVKDEIDWEWPGDAVHEVQSNFFFMGVANYSATNGAHHNVSGADTASTFHTYTLNWQPDVLEWWIDGYVVRSVRKEDTWKDAAQQFQYPTTPSRVQISIWPAGIDASAAGTVDWAGGMIDWSHPDYTSTGYFWNTLKSVEITCTDVLPIGPTDTGYQFVGNDSDNVPIVALTNRSTDLKSHAVGAVAAPVSTLVAALALSLAAPAMAWFAL